MCILNFFNYSVPFNWKFFCNIMCSIPGLTFYSSENELGSGRTSITLNTFEGTITIPQSHRYGNCRRIEEFEKLDKICDGYFNVIYKCCDKNTGTMYNAKKIEILSDSPYGISMAALREISILNILKHVNIVNTHGIAVGSLLENNYLLLDFYSCCLNDLIIKKNKALHEISVIKGIMKQFFNGLCSIHEAKIIHGCLNPQNVKFTSEGILKIGGFKSACYFDVGREKMFNINSLQYKAPELLLHSQSQECAQAIDLWASGCIFAELILQKPIFNGDTTLEVFQSILNVLGSPSEAVLPKSQWHSGMHAISQPKVYIDLKKVLSTVSVTCQEFISSLLLYNPDMRMSSKECLKHLYFQEEPEACSTDILRNMQQEVAEKDESNQSENK